MSNEANSDKKTEVILIGHGAQIDKKAGVIGYGYYSQRQAKIAGICIYKNMSGKDIAVSEISDTLLSRTETSHMGLVYCGPVKEFVRRL